MRLWAMMLLLLPASVWCQPLPFTSPDPNLQENLEWLANQARQNKAAITNISGPALASSQTWTGANTWTSSSTFSGPIFGISSFTCVSLTGVTGGSAATLNLGVANTTFSLTGSTFTITFSGAFCDATGPCTNAAKMGIGFLVDSNFATELGHSSTIPCRNGSGGGGVGAGAPLHCQEIITRALGSHTFTATWDNMSGGGSNQPACDPTSGCRFCVFREG